MCNKTIKSNEESNPHTKIIIWLENNIFPKFTSHLDDHYKMHVIKLKYCRMLLSTNQMHTYIQIRHTICT